MGMREMWKKRSKVVFQEHTGEGEDDDCMKSIVKRL